MNAFLAIVGDTWRQSRQQVVFIILLVIMLLGTAAVIILPKVIVDESGEKRLGILRSETPWNGPEDDWVDSYAASLMENGGEKVNPFTDKGRKEVLALQIKYRAEAEAKAKAVPRLQRGVEMLAHNYASWIYTIAMALFIAAAAGYFPDLLSAGAVDVVLSKPISRLQLVLGKYCGGLSLLSLAILVSYGIVCVGLGLRLGIWPYRIFLAAPLTIFSAAVLYAILAMVGILWRSTALGMVLGYLLYFVIDLVVPLLVVLVKSGSLENWPWLESAAKATPYVFVNFFILKSVATMSVLNITTVGWAPIATAAAWILASLGLGYWIFRRRNF
jgi:ABC-type transport system involved in multi-copper enzyme maturation permease subunit